MARTMCRCAWGEIQGQTGPAGQIKDLTPKNVFRFKLVTKDKLSELQLTD